MDDKVLNAGGSRHFLQLVFGESAQDREATVVMGHEITCGQMRVEPGRPCRWPVAIQIIEYEADPAQPLHGLEQDDRMLLRKMMNCERAQHDIETLRRIG